MTRTRYRKRQAMRYRLAIGGLFLALWAVASLAADPRATDHATATDDDPFAGAETGKPNSDINEGSLHFLDRPLAKLPYRHSKHLTITPASLQSGWIVSNQCHYQLDAVPALEVVFGHGQVRKLEITRADNIEHAWIENDSVQLKNVGANAVLCIHSENHALKFDATNNIYTLTSGPYMRRFLDGYFPMQADLMIDYPA